MFVVLFMTGCDKKEKEVIDYNKYSFAGINWTRDAENDIETIRFNTDGSFIYYCSCGNSVNDSDLCEGYRYDDETKTLYLYDMDKECIGEGKVLEISKDKVIIEKYDEICTYVPVNH